MNQQQHEIQIVHAKQFAADGDLSGLTGQFETAVHRPSVVQNYDDDDDGGGGWAEGQVLHQHITHKEGKTMIRQTK